MTKQPNILHLFTDQQRFDMIGALGNPHIRTPNLDWLVSCGTVFHRAYTPSPECVPARASMITGWYPSRTRCYCNEQAMPPEETPTLMSGLADAGYLTQGIGKCHFTPRHDALRGFSNRLSQEEIVESREADDYATWLVENGQGGVLEPHGVRGEMYYIPQVSLLPEKFHPTTWIGDRTVDFLKSREANGNPWYCYASFIHPHPPFAPPVPWHKDYRAPDMPLPDMPPGCGHLLTFVNRFQNRYKFRDRGWDLNLIRCLRAYYHACISFVDFQIGRIFQTLEASGQLDNTLIVFASDHGEYLGDYGCFGKRGMHEVSARIPLVVRWPGNLRPANAECHQPASLVDLAPTFLEAAGVETGDGAFDGADLRGLAEGSSARDLVFSQYNRAENGLYMAVGKRWKYIFSAPDAREMLFDLERDPREHTDLAGTPGHGRVLDIMRSRCLAHLHARSETAATDGEGWREYPRRSLPENPDAGLLFQDPPWWEAAGSPTPLSKLRRDPFPDQL